MASKHTTTTFFCTLPYSLQTYPAIIHLIYDLLSCYSAVKWSVKETKEVTGTHELM